MKSLLVCFIVIFSASNAFAIDPPKYKKCGKYKGRNLYEGEKGGCFYMKGKKKEHIYIDRKFCRC